MLKRIIALAVCLCGFASVAQAQFPFGIPIDIKSRYAGAIVSHAEIATDGFKTDGEYAAIFGRVGWYFEDFISAEIRAGFGIGEDTVVRDDDVNFDTELNSLVGLYVRGGYSMSGGFYPYAILGYTNAKTRVSRLGLGNSPVEKWRDDVSYGAGVEWNFSDTAGFSLEYISYLDTGGVQLEMLSVGVHTEF